MLNLHQTRQGRFRVVCAQDPALHRDLVTIPFILDRSQPKADADRILEAAQFLWQCVPQCIADSSVFVVHMEVALPEPLHLEGTRPALEYEALTTPKGPLASIQLVHYVLTLQQKLADHATKQTPVLPTAHGWRKGAQGVLDMLARVRGVEA